MSCDQKSSENHAEIPIAKQEEIVITEYMKECFDKVASAEGFKDYDLKINHGSNVGDGFVGNMLKILIKEKSSQKSLEVLVKIPPSNKTRRETMKIMNLFQREIFVYNVALPSFTRMQRDHNVSASTSFNNFPKIYYAEYNEKVDEAVIIMEDLRDSGHKMWNKSVPINFEHAKLLLISLGRLHGLSFAMKSKYPRQFQMIQDLNDDFSDVLQTESFEGLLKGSVIRACDFVKSDDEIAAKMTKLVDNIRDVVIEGVKPKHIEPYAVMLHGDCWINNYLFHYTTSNSPDSIKLIDWQITRYGSPVIDLIYFIFICTDQALRARHFDELIKIYYNSLEEMLSSLDCDASQLFPFAILKDHLRTFGKFGVIMSGFILPALLAKDEQIVDLDYVMENPQDMNGIADHVVEKMIETDSFRKRLRGVIFDAIDYGYL